MDAGKVNTLEKGWRDLKIVVAQKRSAGQAVSPEEWQSRALPRASARTMWADIATSKRFCRNWRTRLKRLGLRTMADLHLLGDGASWIWKSADQVLSGCRQTLDIYDACEHIADAGKRLLGEGTTAATAFFERGLALLLAEGWVGICRLIGEEFAREDTAARRVVLEPMTCHFAAHMTRLGYRDSLATGKAIGSGGVEGAAKTLGLRLKARGARWKHKNARAMAALVCVRNVKNGRASGRWRLEPQESTGIPSADYDEISPEMIRLATVLRIILTGRRRDDRREVRSCGQRKG